jgi:Tfp pilus assembly protein PilN
MIEINLLPPEHRPVERTPLPRFLTTFFGVLLSAAAAVAWLWLSQVAVPRAEKRCQDKKTAMELAKKNAEEVQRIERELKAAKDREGVLRDLFNQRIFWARLLDRLAEARAKVKAGEDVVLTNVDLRKGAGATPGRSAETRQLDIKGFVASSRKDALAAELREKVIFAFLQTLSGDAEFKKDMECDEKSGGSAKYTYVGDQWTEDLRSSSRDVRDPPKCMLSFEVTFTFKAPPAQPTPAPAPPPGPPKPATPAGEH